MIRSLPRVLLTALMFCGFLSTASAEQFIRVGSGIAGTYPIFGAKCAELINKNVTGVKASTISGGTEANLVKVQKGEAEMSIAYTFISALVHNGKGSLKFPAPDLRHLMTLYGSVMQIAATKSSGVTNLRQLKSKGYRVWGSTKASVFYPMIVGALGAHGVSYDDIRKAGGVIESFSYRNSVAAMQDGRLDVGFFSGGVPYSLLMQLEQKPGFILMDFDDAALQKMSELLPGIGKGSVPAGSYAGNPAAKAVPHVLNQLVVSAKVPDDVVYQITKTLNEQYKEFHGLFPGSEEILPKTALDNNAIPVHAGAERYYREVGMIK